MPELRDGVGQIFPLAAGGCYAINANAENPDFAAEVLNNMFTDVERNMTAVREAGFEPYPLKAVTADSFKGIDERAEDMYGMLMEAQSAGAVGYCDWTFFPNDVMVYMNENTDGLFLDMLTVDDYLAQVQSLTDKAIENGEALPIP